MADFVEVRCGACGKPFERAPRSRLTKCEPCRAARPSHVAAVSRNDVSRETEAPEGPRVPGVVEAAAIRELQGRERLDTVGGQVAVRLAATLDAEGHSGSQIAALGKQLKDAMVWALDGAPPARDGVDEHADRRRELLRSVGVGA